MTKYQLNAIDWSTVRLLHGEHLSYETQYHEELTRWAIGAIGLWGVLDMPAGSLILTSSSKDFEVRLSQLSAIMPNGFWVELPGMITFQDANAQYSDRLDIPLYICIEAKKRSIPLAATQSRALAEVNALQMNYFLTTHRPPDANNALQIARLVRRGSQFDLDANYIPPCVRLNSHPTLVQAVQRIARTAHEMVEYLRLEYACQNFKISHVLAATLAMPLSTIETLADWRQSPLSYIEQMGRALRQLHLLIQPLMKLNLPDWKEAEIALRDAWENITHAATPTTSDLPMHLLLEKAENALNKLNPLLRELKEPPPEYHSKEPERRLEGHLPVMSLDKAQPDSTLQSKKKSTETDSI